MTVRAVSFDLDDTLLHIPDIDGAVWIACQAVAALEPAIAVEDLARANTESFAALWPDIEDGFNAGVLEGDDIAMEVWARSLRSCGREDEDLLAVALAAFSSHVEDSYRLFDDADILDVLAGRLPLALITNGPPRTQRRKLELTAIERRFDAVLISGEVGAAKPERLIFSRAAKLLGVAPETIVHVGDNLLTDVAGASAAGMTAVWLNRDERQRDESQPAPRHVISSLTELRRVLDMH